MGKNEINLADNLINIINTARENALKKVNEELINIIKQQSALLKRNVEFNESTRKMYKKLNNYE